MRCSTTVVAVFVALAGILFACVDRQRALEQLVWVLSNTKDMGYVGMVLYVAAFVFATLLLVPTAPLDMAAGLLFSRQHGLYVAVALAAVAKQVSGCAAFLLGRTLLREYVRAELLPRFPIFGAVASAVETDAFMMTCIVRFAPVPTVAKGLCLAASGVPFITFFVASALLALPWSVAGAVVGSTLASLPEILDGRGEAKLAEVLGEWKERPWVFAAAIVLTGVVLFFGCQKIRHIHGLYKEILANPDSGADKSQQ